MDVRETIGLSLLGNVLSAVVLSTLIVYFVFAKNRCRNNVTIKNIESNNIPV